MSATPWVPAVKKISDGETVEASTVNPPLDQLIQRDQHLYEKFNELLGKSVLMAFGQPVHPTTTLAAGLNVVYYKDDVNGTGLAKAITGFSSSNTRSMYAPTPSNFTFGIVSALSTAGTAADLFIQGLCEFSYAMDDPVHGLIEREPASPETFSVGPYYLSRKYPGKITKNPAGVPVYVGYALSRYSFMLQPSVDEFSQFFINYRYNILDRPSATPTLTAGVWTLPTNTPATRLGWAAAHPTVLPGITVPEGAKFFYFIPGGTYAADGASLTDNEKVEASELGGVLPPIPANFVQVSVNGVMQRLRDVYTPDGIYAVDQYGIWWFDDADGKQPWASDLPSGTWTPNDWPTVKGDDSLRPRTFISFSKFNPALRTQLVSSLRPAPGSENILSFVSKDNPLQPAFTGDLYAELTPKFITQASVNSAQAISDLTYDSVSGKFSKAVTPVVSSLVGTGGITATDLGSGQYQVGLNDQGVTGFVDSIEPINSRLEFIGLNSYIRLPATASTTPYGLVAKILLPRGYPVTKDLKLTLHMFGFASVDGVVVFDFLYNVCTLGTLVSANVSPTLQIPVALTGYTANTSFEATAPTLVIPSSELVADSTVNFKLMRNKTSSYTGDIGLLGIYWSI